MPVTAKLSRRFYEVLGDDVANELVEWFNQVDATYRADLFRMNEANFGRSDAKLEQRFAEFELKIDRRFAQFEAKVNQRFADLEAKVDRRFVEIRAEIDQRFDLVDKRFVDVDQRLTKLEATMGIGFQALRSEMALNHNAMQAEMAKFRSSLIMWMVTLWVTGMGLAVALIQLLK